MTRKPLLLALVAACLLSGCSRRQADPTPAAPRTETMVAVPNEPVMVPNDAPAPEPVAMQFDKTQLRRELALATMTLQSIRDAWDIVDAMNEQGKIPPAHWERLMDALPDFSKGDASAHGRNVSLAEIRRLIESGQTRAASAKWRSRLAYIVSRLSSYTIPDTLSGSVRVGDETFVYECDASGRVLELADEEYFNRFVSDGEREAPQSLYNLLKTAMDEGSR